MRDTCLILVLSGLCLASGCGPKENPLPPSARLSPPPPAVDRALSGSNALAFATALVALGPRDAGTPGGRHAADWIAATLRENGLQARLDTFTNDTPSGIVTCHNVVAELPGRDASWVVLLSHFDTKSGLGPGFVGANDGASSTGLLLELARVLKAHPPRRVGVLFGFLDGEECRVSFGPHDGLHGSRRLAAQLAGEGRRVQATMLLDMIGDRDLGLTLPANGTPELLLMAMDAARAVGARDQVRLFDGAMIDDHQPFLDAGFPAIDLIDFQYGSAAGLNDYWHTPQDTLDKLSDASLATVGRIVLGMFDRLDPAR